MQDLTNSEKIRTVGDLMNALEDEIAKIKSGELKEPQARIIMRGRQLQMKAFDIVVQMARCEAKLRPRLERLMGPTVDVAPEEPKPGAPN